MLSILELAEEVNARGVQFQRDPWTGSVSRSALASVPSELREALEARWLDLEALIAEQTPPREKAVQSAERLLLKH